MQKWNLEVITINKSFSISSEQLEKWKDETIPVDDYVPGKEGEAVFLMGLLKNLGVENEDFSDAIFTAGDGYEQKIQRMDLQSAFLLFKQKGEPLKKGFPVRLYVPTSENDCLNVKSVVKISLCK